MVQAFFFSSTAQPTTLSASISSSQTTIPLAATTGFPVSFPFTIALDYGTSLEELNTVTSLSGLNANVIRGVDGTSASSHSVGAVVRHVSAARDFNSFYIHMGSSAGVHGIVGNVVGDSDTQTLSNKTLTSPTITGTIAGSPTFSGTLGIGNVSGGMVVTSPAIGTVPIIARGAAGQTADLFTVQTNGLTSAFRVFNTGNVLVNNMATSAVALTVNGPTGQTADLQEWQVNGGTFLSLTSAQNFQFFPSSGTAEILGSQPPSVGTFDMVRMRADGRFDWGPGTATRDTDLYRNGVNILKTDGAFQVGSLAGGAIQATGTSTFTQTLNGNGSVAIFNGGGVGNTAPVLIIENNGTQVATVDGSGTWNGPVSIPPTAVGFTATVFKTADTSRASTTTLAADPDLVFGFVNMVVGATYMLDGFINYTGAAIGTGDLKATMTASVGTDIGNSVYLLQGAPTSSATAAQNGALPFSSATALGSNGATVMGARLSGWFTVVTAAPSLTLFWSQNTSNATATVIKAGSWMTLTRIA